MKELRFSLIMLLLLFFLSCENREQKLQKEKELAKERKKTEFDNFLKTSYAYLIEQQKICQNEYNLDSLPYWNYNHYAGELTFSDSANVKLFIQYEIVGSISLQSNTWLWSWSNPNLPEIARSEIIKVREHGERKGFQKLTSANWPATEVNGWEMTAIANYLLKGKGAFRIPDNDIMIFVVFKDIRKQLL